MKLSLHLQYNVVQHFVLSVQLVSKRIPAEHFIANLRPLDIEAVQKEMVDYGNRCIRDGLKLVHDGCGPFFETLTTRMDYSNHQIYPTTNHFEANPSIRGQCTVLENRHQILRPMGIPNSLSSPESSVNTSSVTGHLRPVQENTEPNEKIDVKIQRKRASSMTLEEISNYFHLPLVEASKKIRLCATSLKRICRRFNIKRWPYRKVISMGMKTRTVKEFQKK